MPWDDQWDANYANYAPVVIGVSVLGIWLGWRRAKSHFTGQERTIDDPNVEHIPEEFQ